MVNFTLYDISPMDCLDIVRELKNSGYSMGVDFIFAYSPPVGKYVDSTYVTTGKSATFTFTKEESATWFALKYG